MTITPGAVAAQEVTRRLGPLSWYARRRKLDYFLERIPRHGRILDVGCGDNWFKSTAGERGWNDVLGLDLVPPADVVGDVTKWRDLGLDEHSFDAIVAFEVIEHGDFARSLHELLKPDGQLMVTTPLPQMDGICQILEKCKLLQQRGSPHTHLTDIRRFPFFAIVERQIKAGISQWGILRPLPD